MYGLEGVTVLTATSTSTCLLGLGGAAVIVYGKIQSSWVELPLTFFGMFVLLLSSSSLPRVMFATGFRISADTTRSALPHSVSSGARVFVVLISVHGIRFPLRGTLRRALRQRHHFTFHTKRRRCAQLFSRIFVKCFRCAEVCFTLVPICSGRFRGPYRECEKDNVAVFVVFKVSRRTTNPSKSRPLLFGGETHVRLQVAVSGPALAGVHRCLSPCVVLAHWHAMSNVSLSPNSL